MPAALAASVRTMSTGLVGPPTGCVAPSARRDGSAGSARARASEDAFTQLPMAPRKPTVELTMLTLETQLGSEARFDGSPTPPFELPPPVEHEATTESILLVP